ncbi:MAG: YeeE/YedE family protein [Proteobacteria bacterium]|nr:YeeE/YedE family protein [Pseudomonadota bacterium]
MPLLTALVSGLLFGAGLALSGMVNPAKVLNFLDVAGTFDPTLLFVLGGAVATTTGLFRFVLRRGQPVLAETFQLSNLQQIDRRLLGGAALFGIGWGIAGYCPGPALAGLGIGSVEALGFVPAMLAGILLHRTVNRA